LQCLLLWMNSQHWMWPHWTSSCSSEHGYVGIILWAHMGTCFVVPVEHEQIREQSI
jgi:hypothetical protein